MTSKTEQKHYEAIQTVLSAIKGKRLGDTRMCAADRRAVYRQAKKGFVSESWFASVARFVAPSLLDRRTHGALKHTAARVALRAGLLVRTHTGCDAEGNWTEGSSLFPLN